MSKFEEMKAKVEKAILASGQKKVYVCYSVCESDEDDEPIDNLDEIAVEGKVILMEGADEFWGGKKAKNYCSEILENPTWLQVAVCANAMIRRTRDTHNVFLEGLDRLGPWEEWLKKLQKKYKAEGVFVYSFLMGS